MASHWIQNKSQHDYHSLWAMSQPELSNPCHLVPSTHQTLFVRQALVVLCLFLCLTCLKGHLLICRVGHRDFFLTEGFSNNTACNSDCMLLFSATRSCQFPQPRCDYWVCLLLGNEYTYSRYHSLYIMSIITKRHEGEKWGGRRGYFYDSVCFAGCLFS